MCVFIGAVAQLDRLSRVRSGFEPMLSLCSEYDLGQWSVFFRLFVIFLMIINQVHSTMSTFMTEK